MMRSMYSAVSGLKTHQQKMDVIGNNIANVNTVAFKSTSVTFNDVMYQTMSSASGTNELTGTGGINAKQIGLGVTTAAMKIDITSEGASQTTGSGLDMKISGENFFIVSNGSENLFTRDGSFYFDGSGNLCMSSTGYNVMGWQVDEDGNIVKDTVSALRIMSAANQTASPEATTQANISGILDANTSAMTSDSGYNMSLTFYDALGYKYTAKFTVSEADDDGNYIVSLAKILDSNGDEVTATATDDLYGVWGASGTVTKTTTISADDYSSYISDSNYSYDSSTGLFTDSTTSTTYTLAELSTAGLLATVFGGGTSTNVATASGWSYTAATGTTDGTFSYTGSDDTITAALTAAGLGTTGLSADDLESAGLLSSAVPNATTSSAKMYTDLNTVYSLNADGELTVTTDKLYRNGEEVEFNTSTGAFNMVSSTNGTTTTLTATKLGGNFSDITVDFADAEMYDNGGTSTLSCDRGATDGSTGLGCAVGNLTSVTVSSNGEIYGSYDNNKTILLGQIATAQFANASGLESVGSNCYAATLNSGDFDGIGVDVTADGGSINTGVLEMSNVDLSTEFTNMITTQRGFQANSRVITTSDTLLEELINLKR